MASSVLKASPTIKVILNIVATLNIEYICQLYQNTFEKSVIDSNQQIVDALEKCLISIVLESVQLRS